MSGDNERATDQGVEKLYTQDDLNRAVQDSIFAFRRENQLPLDDESTASDVDYTALCLSLIHISEPTRPY